MLLEIIAALHWLASRICLDCSDDSANLFASGSYKNKTVRNIVAAWLLIHCLPIYLKELFWQNQQK